MKKKVKPPRFPKINLKHLRVIHEDVMLYSDSDSRYHMLDGEIFLPLSMMNGSDRRIKVLTKTAQIVYMCRFTWNTHTTQL